MLRGPEPPVPESAPRGPAAAGDVPENGGEPGAWCVEEGSGLSAIGFVESAGRSILTLLQSRTGALSSRAKSRSSWRKYRRLRRLRKHAQALCRAAASCGRKPPSPGVSHVRITTL